MACILVVEDQPASRDMLATLLGYHGHVVLQARDGVEGLALALAKRPDLAITDILMPGMDGYEFARRVRAAPSLPDTRVMFYTATYLVEEVRRLAADCGVTYVLEKPAEPEQVLAAVEAALAAEPLAVDAEPSAAADREHLRVLTDTLHRKVEELKAEVAARERAEAEVRQRADRARVQAEVSRGLAELTGDYQAMLDLTARRLAEEIGDAAVLAVLSDDGGAEVAAAYDRDPQVTPLLRAALAARPTVLSKSIVERVIEVGQPLLIATTSPEQIAPQIDPESRPNLQRFGVSSVMVAPLRAQGRILGVVSLRRSRPGNPYTQDDLNFLQDLADRAALAMSNARLYADLQSTNTDLERRVAERTAELRQRTTMIDAAGDAIIIRDLAKDIIVYWNRGAERLYGWTTEQAIGQSIHSLLQTEFPAPLADIKAALLRAGHWEGELEHTCRDGRRITVLSRWTLDRDAVGQPASFLEINTDITARKQAEAALREARDELERRVAERTAALAQSEKKFRTLADNALVGIFQSAIDGQILYANEALAQLMGFPSTAELMQETSTMRYRRPEDRAAMIDLLWRGGKVMNREVDLLTKAGAVRTVLSSMSLDGDVISGMLIDITDRKQAVQALRESEERLRTVTDTARVGLVIVSEEHRYRYANRSYAEILRLPTDDLVGLRVADVLAPVYEQQIRPRLQRAFLGERVSYELVLPAAAGEQPRRYAVTYEPSEDSSGPIVVVVIVDISEQRQAEEGIRRLNAELELRVQERTAELANVNDELQSANSELQSEIEERTQLEGRIRANAERAVALSELSRVLAETSVEYQPLFDRIVRRISELVGDTCVVTLLSDDRQWLDTVAIYHPDPDGTAFMRALMAAERYRAEGGLVGRVVQTGKALLIPVVSQEQVRVQMRPEYYSYLDRFGMASLLIVPLRAGGRTLGTLGVSRDRPGRPYSAEEQSFLQDLADRAALAIQNTRLFVEAREAREAADRANLAKSEFLSSMSHELRTPLNAIIGFTGTLLMKLPGPLNADQDKQLKTIQSSARHLLSLINDLLDVAKIESGKLKIYPEPVTCQEVLDEAVTSLRPLADQKGLQLTADCPPEPIVLQTDRRSLSQIVINLVNNAIKFTERGEVTISLRRTASNPAGSSEALSRALVVTFAVRDTGIGIKAEDQERLFHAFEQISSAKTGRREGSGLGLHLSMRLAELIGGRIEFQSEYGVGSTFTLVMPEQ